MQIKRFFLSVYFLKSAISIGIVATLLIGVCLLYVLVYAFIISSVTAQIQSSFRNIFIGVFLTSSLMMIASSISAIYGMIRKKNKLLVVYAVTMAVYFISFLLLGIFSMSYPNSLRAECTDNPEQSTFSQNYKAANSTLCKGDCACYFPQFDKYSVQQQQIIQNMGSTNRTSNSSDPINAQNCPQWSNETYTATSQLAMLETFFSCSGWCDVNEQFNLYYLFSNINHGVPESSCVDALVNFFEEFGSVLKVSSFLVSSVLFAILLTILCLCFHPQKSREYDAMSFFKDTFVVPGHLQEENSQLNVNLSAFSEKERPTSLQMSRHHSLDKPEQIYQQRYKQVQ